MGITIVQKSDLSRPHHGARKALVLAGGAISGGAFKLGGLEAFDRFLGSTRVNDFDMFMGISAGAFIAAPIAGGLPPSELVEAFVGEPTRMPRFRMSDFYYPNFAEFWARPAAAVADLARMGPRATGRLLRGLPELVGPLARRTRDFLADPGLETAEALAAPVLETLADPDARTYGWLPSGIFDNRRIEAYVRESLERNGIPNDFRQLKLSRGKSLYIGATNINTAQGAVFGHDEDHSVTISEAVQASTAIPGFFRPARIGPPGREQDYVDAAVRKTANISVPVRHGAQLVVCYNPFRPFVNYRHRLVSDGRSSIADLGMAVILNQAFRTMLHSRLRLGIEKLKLDETFRGDVILIEPTETDARFFSMNPVAFWNRKAAAEHGFESVKLSLHRHYETLRTILGAYGIKVDLGAIGDSLRSEAGRKPSRSARVAEPEPGRPSLRVVAGGRR
jgi:NTE family protein